MKDWHLMSIVKGLLYMLTNRVERLEKRVDELEENHRAASTKEFEKAKKYFEKELNELDKLT